MKFQASVIKEQGVKFAIVIVKEYVLNNRNEANNLIKNFQARVFGEFPWF